MNLVLDDVTEILQGDYAGKCTSLDAYVVYRGTPEKDRTGGLERSPSYHSEPRRGFRGDREPFRSTGVVDP